MKKKILAFALLLLSAIPAFASLEGDYLYFSPQMRGSHLTSYNQEEIGAIEKDLAVVRSVCFSEAKLGNSSQKPVYIATAGGPGARKSTILERFLSQNPHYSTVVYLDPDPRSLKYMVHTYYSRSLCPLAVSGNPDYSISQKNAYEKWRGGSNYITLTLMEEAFANKRDIAHGTTSTGEHVSSFFSKLKEADYEVVLLICSCEDSFRYNAIKYRNAEQRFYQSTPEDAVAKGKMFPRRMPAYFTYADVIYLYWSDDLSTEEKCAAVFSDGKLKIFDEMAYGKFVQKYEADRANFLTEGVQLPSWKEVTLIYLNR